MRLNYLNTLLPKNSVPSYIKGLLCAFVFLCFHSTANAQCTAGQVAPEIDGNLSTNFCDAVSVDLNPFVISITPDNASLRWSLTATPANVGDLLPSSVVTTSGTYFAVYLGVSGLNLCVSPTAPLTISLNTTPLVTTVSSDGAICDSGTTILRAETNSVTATLRWFDMPTGGTSIGTGPVLTTPNISATTTFYVEAIENDCVSARMPIDAVVNLTPSAGTPNNNNQRCSVAGTGNGITNVDLDNTINDETEGGDWQLISGPAGNTITISMTNVVSFNMQPNGDYIFRYTTNTAILPCVDQSVEVTITVTDCAPTCDAGNDPPELVNSIPTIFCDDIDVSLNAYTNSAPPAGTTLVWSTNPDPLVVSGHLADNAVANPIAGTYFGFFYDAVNLCASPTLEITLVMNMTPDINSTTGGTICGPGSLTLTASVSAGGTLNWYETATSTDIIETGGSFVTPTVSATRSYFVEATANGCTSDRIAVTITVNPQPSAGTTTNTAACSISGNGGPTVVDLDDQLMGADQGLWTVISDPSGGNAAINANNEVDFEDLPDGDYIFQFTTNIALAPCTNESVEVTISVNDCLPDSDNDGLKDGEEATLGTDPNNEDTDGDGINDSEEVGADLNNPLDEDEDGIIDALDSNVLDSDMDGVVDQLDPANDNPCIPDNTIGLCDTDNDGISDGDEIADGTDPFDACDPNLTPDCQPADIDLSVEKIADKETVIVGDEVVFTITLSNLSMNRVLGIQISEVIASGFQYISDQASIGTYNRDDGIWEIFEIAPLAIHTLEITVEVLENGDYDNTANLLESFPNDGDMSNNEATITINVGKPTNGDCGFLFSQFSPNGDGINDFLKINCIEQFPGNTLEIFDRYGNNVYRAKNYDNSWNGTGKNGNLPKGTYFYLLNLADGTEVKKGWIQIIR